MKRTKTLRILDRLAVVVTLLGLATAPALRAQFECKQEAAAGTWVANYWYAQFDSPVAPPAIAGVASGTFDEQGKATEWKYAEMGSDGFFPWGFDITEVFDIQATVNADCTLNITATDPATGELVFDTHFVCADGQQECWGIITRHPLKLASGEPALAGIITLKWIEPLDRQLQAKVDSLTAKVDDLEAIVRAIAGRLSIPNSVLP